MAQRTDTFELERLSLRSGEGRRLELFAALEPLSFAGQPYTVEPPLIPVQLDVSRTTNSGWALRLRFAAEVHGPCMRCLEPASPRFEIDAREVDQPGGGDELSSPYVHEGDLNLHDWARDALLLAMPPQVTCRPDCRGLCPQCGENLNDHPDHEHERPPDQRWAKLAEIRFDQ